VRDVPRPFAGLASADRNSGEVLGRFQTTHRWLGFAGQETRYFDKAGKLIAVRVETDVFLKDEGPFWRHYGAAIACRVINMNLLCKPDAGRPKKE
jgi:hypothetical protein